MPQKLIAAWSSTDNNRLHLTVKRPAYANFFHWPKLAAMLLTMGISACGFHVRGSGIDVAGVRVFVQSPDAYGELGRVLHDSLLQSELLVSEQSDTAQLALIVRNDKLTRRVQTVDPYGRAADYELIYTLNYVISAPQLTEQSNEHSMSARREYSFDNTDVLGKAEEENLLVSEMRKELAQRLLRQLRYNAAQLPSS